MCSDRPIQTSFLPTATGTGWPYSVMLLLGAGICAYIAADLYLAFAAYERTPPRDYIVVAAICGFALAFLAAAWGFWFFPWSWAHLRIGARGVDLSVRGLGACPQTHLAWHELSRVSVVILPRHASVLKFGTGEGLTKTIRAVALADDLDAVLPALQAMANTAGFELSGAPIAVPILGTREWAVTARA